jgi:hypothetical protein
MAEEDDVAQEAWEITSAIGGGIAAVGGVASAAAGVAVAGAAAVGVGVGMGIDYLTDGAISDGISDGLLGLVGDEESLAAANSFDNGDYIQGVGHMLSGAGETIADTAGEVYDTVADGVGEAYDEVSDFVGDAVDYLNPF